MFKVVSTGEGKYYGKKGEIILISDFNLVYCLKNKFIDIKTIEYIGNCDRNIIPSKFKRYDRKNEG